MYYRIGLQQQVTRRMMIIIISQQSPFNKSQMQKPPRLSPQQLQITIAINKIQIQLQHLLLDSGQSNCVADKSLIWSTPFCFYDNKICLNHKNVTRIM